MHGRGEEAGGGEECAGEELVDSEAVEEGHGKESGGGRGKDQGPRTKNQARPRGKGVRVVFQCASKLRRILVFGGACLRAILHFTD